MICGGKKSNENTKINAKQINKQTQNKTKNYKYRQTLHKLIFTN